MNKKENAKFGALLALGIAMVLVAITSAKKSGVVIHATPSTKTAQPKPPALAEHWKVVTPTSFEPISVESSTVQMNLVSTFSSRKREMCILFSQNILEKGYRNCYLMLGKRNITDPAYMAVVEHNMNWVRNPIDPCDSLEADLDSPAIMVTCSKLRRTFVVEATTSPGDPTIPDHFVPVVSVRDNHLHWQTHEVTLRVPVVTSTFYND